ncbi:MAG: hypothetical protein QXI35_07785 [Candidatus Nezhaarchaeales archaeon]
MNRDTTVLVVFIQDLAKNISSLTILNALIAGGCSRIMPPSIAPSKLEVDLGNPLEYKYRLKLANSVERFEGFKRGYGGGLHPRKNQSL